MIARNALILFALSAGLAAAQGNVEATLSGLVSDASGKALAGARVTLQRTGETVRTGADGKYRFTGASSPLRRPASAAAAAMPRWLDGALGLEVDAASRHVTVDVHALSGRLEARAFEGDLPAGRWQVAPFANGAALPAGAYVARVRIGKDAYAVPIAWMGRGLGWPGARRAEGPGSVALRKSAAVADTLEVVAVGYERGERQLESLQGTQDFKLNPVKYVNVPYKSGVLNNAEKAACILDVHMPKTGSNWPVVIHLHGGGMTGGDRNEAFGADYRYFGNRFLDAGIIEVAPGYRLIGQGTWPDYIRDAAQAAIWVRKNIEAYGGDPHSVFITGFSAGAYLTHMLAIDSTWWNEAKFDPKRFAGFVSLSGQTRQHANIQADLKVKNIMQEKPYAMPMGHIHKTTYPWQIFVGGLEGNTITDNKALYDALINAGSTDLHYDVIPNQPHTVGDMADATSPKRDKFFAFIQKYKGKGL
jgi:predicted esterase